MAYTADSERFVYSGAVFNSDVAQSDPLLSIGGAAVVSATPATEDASRPYRAADTTAPFQVGSRTIVDSTAAGPEASDPAVGDWYLHMLGANAAFIAKIESIDQAQTRFTLDRPIPTAMVATSNFRTSRRGNLFDDLDATAAVDGFVDYRCLWFEHAAGSGEGGFRWYVKPIKPNGCTLEIAIANPSNQLPFPTSRPRVYTPPDRFTDPLLPSGLITDVSNTFENPRYLKMGKRRLRASPDQATPFRGMDGVTQIDQHAPIWIKRTVRAGTRGGECAFELTVKVDNPTAPDPDPYESGVILSWFLAQPTYTATIEQDRIAFTNGAAKLFATITDDRGVPVPDLNCWFELVSGGGTVVVDRTLRTNASGVVQGIYSAPPSIGGGDPIVRVVIPENLET